MNVGDIYFGDIDAKHEVESADEEHLDEFVKSFVIPKNVDPTKFLSEKNLL